MKKYTNEIVTHTSLPPYPFEHPWTTQKTHTHSMKNDVRNSLQVFKKLRKKLWYVKKQKYIAAIIV